MFESLGNIGDFVGGIGVIVTVGYLAYQVRLNTQSTQSASYQAAVSAVSDWSREVALNKDAVRVIQTGLSDPAVLDDVDRAQFDMLNVSLVRNFENIHYQFETGAIPKSTWDGWSLRICSYLALPGAREWWETQKSAYSLVFQEFIASEKNVDSSIGRPFADFGRNK